MFKNDDLLPRRIRHNNSFPRLRRNFASPAVSVGISTEASAAVVACEKRIFKADLSLTVLRLCLESETKTDSSLFS